MYTRTYAPSIPVAVIVEICSIPLRISLGFCLLTPNPTSLNQRGNLSSSNEPRNSLKSRQFAAIPCSVHRTVFWSPHPTLLQFSLRTLLHGCSTPQGESTGRRSNGFGPLVVSESAFKVWCGQQRVSVFFIGFRPPQVTSRPNTFFILVVHLKTNLQQVESTDFINRARRNPRSKLLRRKSLDSALFCSVRAVPAIFRRRVLLVTCREF